VLVLTVFGVAYTTFSRQPIKGYWELLVPFIVVICTRAGWQNASDGAARWRVYDDQQCEPMQRLRHHQTTRPFRKSYPDMVFGERHLRHLLRVHADYYNRTRTHVSLNKDSPASRAAESFGHILPVPILGGLHHQYVRI
jgi:hypothetical protein